MDAAADEHVFARRIAERAGALLLDIRSRGADGEVGDRRSHELLVAEIATAYPDDAILSEEGVDDARRLSSSRVWIVDPLDGTREFGERDRDDWAVHVALVIDGTLAAGAVALPARSLTLGTRPRTDVRARAAGPIRVAVSRTRPPEVATRIATALDAALVPMGSAGAKVAAVILGEVDAYVHAGGQWEWDSAAPVAVAMAAGLHASRIDGAALTYNQPRPWLPDLVVCRRELAIRVLEAAC